jgi:3D (Asp-Asp-Asp) domain-containing protein
MSHTSWARHRRASLRPLALIAVAIFGCGMFLGVILSRIALSSEASNVNGITTVRPAESSRPAVDASEVRAGAGNDQRSVDSLSARGAQDSDAPRSNRESAGLVMSQFVITDPARTPAPQRRKTVDSTAYVWTGNRTASGIFPQVGMVACNFLPFGTRVTILSGPLAGQTLTVTDRIGHSSEFDVFMDTYEQAIQYGRRSIQVAW